MEDKTAIDFDYTALHAHDIHESRSIVLVTGCFDIIHVGHVRFLRYAKSFGDVLWVGLNSDESVRLNKGHGRPINSQEDRAFMLFSLDCVNCITIFSDVRPDELIKKIQPDILVKSTQYNRPDSPSKILVESYGGKVVYYKDIEGYSTTELLDKIARQQTGIGEY